MRSSITIGLNWHLVQKLESELSYLIQGSCILCETLVYYRGTQQKAVMATETHKRLKFSADYGGDFTPELLKTMEERTDCKNRTELMLKAFSALDENLSGQSVVNLFQGLTESEKSLVDEALKVERIDLNELMKRGLLMIAKSYVSSAASKKQLGFDGMSFCQLAKLGTDRRTIRGLSEAKIEKAFEMIQEFNKDQSDEEQRLYVSQDLIYKITNSNLVTIKKWVENHPTDIEEANHGIEPKRGMKREEIRKLLADYMDR